MFKATILSLLLLTTYSAYSSEALEKKLLKSNPEFVFNQYMNQKITLEDFILYQIYQETKCDYWHDTVKLPVTCLKNFPFQSKGSYILNFQAGLSREEIDEFNEFMILSDERKVKYIKSLSLNLRDSIRKMIVELYSPYIPALSKKQIEKEVEKQFKFNIDFSYGEGYRYLVKFTQESEILIEKINTGIKAL